MKLEITKISDLDVEEITKNALEEFIKRLKKFAGDNLISVILFGSMARGDYDKESDTDVFILLDKGKKNINNISHDIVDIAYDTNEAVNNFDVYISPFVQAWDGLMEKYKGISWWRLKPILYDIADEGKILYAGRRAKDIDFFKS